MAQDDYIKLKVGDYEIQTTNPDDIGVSISYSLEDENNFQSKKSSEAFDVVTPAIIENSRAANSFHNPSVEDLTDGKVFRNFQAAVIESSGFELLVGKAIMKKAVHNDKPVSYTWNFHGDNADWLIDLKEVTLYDVLKRIKFLYLKATIEASWAFDGSNEQLPYVFAPVKYRAPFGGYTVAIGPDDKPFNEPVNNKVDVTYLRPALSKYWIMYWGFQIVGYKIDSAFCDTEFYKRMVMPWTWCNFLESEGTRLEKHRFLAKIPFQGAVFMRGGAGGHSYILNTRCTNDSTNGAYDVNNEYSYNTLTNEMTWQYLPPHYGRLKAFFSGKIDVRALVGYNSYFEIRAQWFVNGVMVDGESGAFSSDGNQIYTVGAGATETKNPQESIDFFGAAVVDPNDIVTLKIFTYLFESKVGVSEFSYIFQFIKLDYFKIPLGGTIDFANYTALKKYKFLDFLSGECDLWNLSFNTDSIKKVVYIEPTHPYSLNNDSSIKQDGYFKNDFIDWESKKDFSKDWDLELYADGEREQLLKFRDDPNDGILKVVQDRNVIVLGQGKYVLPERFKAGKHEIENRFFAPTMHFDVDEFKTLGTGSNANVSPQMICIVPENISNTSQSEANNTFLPKSAYYKGLVTGAGAWSWDGTIRQDYPFMFAVNYKDGGENDPIISYTDEKISSGAGFVIGKGLLKRFYWQRMAILRNGQRYTNAWLRLTNYDVANQLHREFKILEGHKWELIRINNFKPLRDDSTSCLLYKWVPILIEDDINTFPSADSIIIGSNSLKEFDIKYAALKCLITDIPTT